MCKFTSNEVKYYKNKSIKFFSHLKVSIQNQTLQSYISSLLKQYKHDSYY